MKKQSAPKDAPLNKPNNPKPKFKKLLAMIRYFLWKPICGLFENIFAHDNVCTTEHHRQNVVKQETSLEENNITRKNKDISELGFLPLEIEGKTIKGFYIKGTYMDEVRFFTRLNIIYIRKLLNSIYRGKPNNPKCTNKRACLIDDQLFEVLYGERGWFPKILYRFCDQLKACLTFTNCVMVVRFDLHLAAYSLDNKIMTIFWRRFTKKLKRKYNNLKLGYLWVREQELAEQQHYHVAVIVDKNLIHYSGIITCAVIDVWKGLMNNQAHIPENPYYVVKQGCWPSFFDCLRRVAYFAKLKSKGKRPIQTNDYGSSRLKPVKITPEIT